MFVNEAKQFIQKAVSIRIALIKNQVSEKNNAEMLHACTWLEKHIKGLPFTDIQMAGFILKHQNAILEILPGKHAGNYKTLTDELNSLLAIAREIKK